MLGLLLKDGEQYGLTPEAAKYLDRASPDYMGAVLGFLQSEYIRGAFEGFTEAVRRGGTAMDGTGSLEPGHPMWVRFAQAMAPLMKPAAERLAEIALPAGRVLDIAAGHGRFGIRLLEGDPQAHVTAVDWPDVLELALHNARLAGVDARYRLLPGSVFDVQLDGIYDTVLLPNFLHHFNRAEIVELLRRMRGALRPGGRVFVLEYLPDASRVKPAAAAWFATSMLVTTPEGDAYTADEYREMLGEAGFGEIETTAVEGAARHWLTGYKYERKEGSPA
jgi:2-polyprenyl-3-methyl-5-hydroxy-6-metoxy-1,4-benzoquinol methylase